LVAGYFGVILQWRGGSARILIKKSPFFHASPAPIVTINMRVLAAH
jgi:hypothetical protein